MHMCMPIHAHMYTHAHTFMHAHTHTHTGSGDLLHRRSSRHTLFHIIAISQLYYTWMGHRYLGPMPAPGWITTVQMASLCIYPSAFPLGFLLHIFTPICFQSLWQKIKDTWRNQLKRGKGNLAHVLRGFGPWSMNSSDWGPEVREKSWWGVWNTHLVEARK